MNRIPIARIQHEWNDLAQALKPALEGDKAASSLRLLGDLLSGTASVYRLGGDASGLLVLKLATTYEDNQALWISYMVGRVPADWYEETEPMLKQIASLNACTEVRVEGRVKAWGKKLRRFGFVPAISHGIPILRKVM